MRSTLIGIGINLFLAVFKGAAGIIGTSYALVADAIESATDVLSSLLVYIGLKVAAKPADENHPEGHGKAEPLAAFAVALFLFFAAIGIAYKSIHEIVTPHVMPAPWTLIVLVGVVVVKETLFRFVFKVGEEVGSTAVKGDAWHHRSDALTSIAAFIGISVALIGSRYNPSPRWSSADDWAALLASGLIAFNGWGILRNALYELTDAYPGSEIEEEIRRIAGAVSGVDSLDKCLIRKMGFDYYVELDVRVDRNMPVYEAHAIAHRVQDVLRAEVKGGRIARVLVHIEPSLLPPQTPPDPVE
jgi:cation diffusion facilitator family transporter